MLRHPTRPFLAPALLILGIAASGCGASSPTAPAPGSSPLALGAGNYSLMIYGTSTCLSGAGGVPSAATVAVVLSTTGSSDVWRVSAPGQTLVGEVAIVNAAVQGWLRGSALTERVRLATGATPDAALAFEGRAQIDRYAGPVLVGSPQFEGIGAASGAITTCASNAFTLKRA